MTISAFTCAGHDPIRNAKSGCLDPVHAEVNSSIESKEHNREQQEEDGNALHPKSNGGAGLCSRWKKL